MTKKMSRAEAKAAAKAKTAKAIESLKAGVIELVEGDAWQAHLDFQAKFHGYSFRNCILMAMQRKGISWVAGFQAWRKHGRHVKKGEKGLAILAPLIGKRKEEQEDGSEKERSFLYGFKVVYVFDISQTDGKPVPVIATELQGNGARYNKAYNVLKDYAENTLKVPVEVKEITDGSNGYYRRPMMGEKAGIVIKDGMNDAQRTKTLAHEVAHAILHTSEEDRHSRPEMEVEAESVAYVVFKSLGLDSSGYSFGYVASWSNSNVELVEKTGARIQKAAHQILDRIGESLGIEQQEAA